VVATVWSCEEHAEGVDDAERIPRADKFTGDPMDLLTTPTPNQTRHKRVIGAPSWSRFCFSPGP
jgi:hypothetical protein